MDQLTIGPAEASQLADLLRAAGPGTRVQLAPGEYPVAALLVKQAVTLEGSDPRSTRILFQGRRFGVVLQGGRLHLKGLTLCNGESLMGGGIVAVNNAELTLEHCILSGNRAANIGGAVHLEQSSATFTRCLFRGNQAPAGAALSVHMGSRATVDRCLFLDNEAQVGGALVINEDARVLIKSCSFYGNRATLESEGEEGGAALAILGTIAYGPQVQVINCLFRDRRPLANPPPRSGALQLTSCLLPPGSLEGVIHSDGGDNLEAEARLTELEGLPLLAAGSPGRGMGSIIEIEDGALDLLGRPLVVRGETDPGALGPWESEPDEVGADRSAVDPESPCPPDHQESLPGFPSRRTPSGEGSVAPEEAVRRTVCERCGVRQPGGWKRGNRCPGCGSAIRAEVRCPWCAKWMPSARFWTLPRWLARFAPWRWCGKWMPSARFCQSCGSELVEESLFGAARMLRAFGVNGFSLAQRTRELDSDPRNDLTRRYAAQLATVARRVDEVCCCERYLLTMRSTYHSGQTQVRPGSPSVPILLPMTT